MEIYTALVLGLVGGLHCAGMCGPLALALPGTDRSGLIFLLGRIAYNAGRIISYGLLGILFGALGKTFWMAGFQRWTSIALGVLLLAGLFASHRIALWQPITMLVQKVKTGMSGLLRKRSLTALGVLGILNGFLPCGLVYVACAGAAATGSIGAGVEYMGAFGLGTVPTMLAISLSGKLMPITLRLKLRKAIPVSVFLLAALLILRGMSLGIPYVSPVLASQSGDPSAAPACCSH
jgi:sulfite exporter TauE/SafE